MSTEPIAPIVITDSPVELAVESDPKVQLAGQQNGRLVINTVRISNRGEYDLHDLRVDVEFDPAIGTVAGCDIVELPARETIVISGAALGIKLSAERLMTQTERQSGAVSVRVVSADHAQLAATHRDLQVLPHNEWAGGTAPPEQLAAFVTPNHPSIGAWLSRTVEVLRRNGHKPDLEGYQSRDPARVAQIAAAIYGSLGQAGVTYANPPASFEKSGQKIRTPEQIAGEQLATCLDISVLFASMLEQAGLNPFIVLEEGHAYPGVWLTDWYAHRPWLDDVSDIRKRVQLGEALVFDSSAATRQIGFDRACEIANSALNADAKFMLAVDVKGARDTGVRPVTSSGNQVQPTRSDFRLDVSTALPNIPTVGSAGADDTPETRLERWKSRLLDLSLNNRLLNHKDTKTTLPLNGANPADIEDALRTRSSLTLVARPDARMHADLDLDEHAQGQLQRGALVVNLPEAESLKRITELYRTGQNLLQETGSCPIYVAFGMLRWFESPSSDVVRLAPILLQPVVVERDSARGPYRLTLGDDEPMLNISLVKKLDHDFGLKVTDLSELPTDDAGLDVDEILRRFLRSVRDEPRFEVLWRTDIALYQFRKFLMWQDLDLNTDLLLQSDVVHHLLVGSGAPFPRGPDFPDVTKLDQERSAKEDLSVVDADSSQLAAIFGALDGNSFVLQGPPGTGKSQTITNLIGQALGKGKTVLFVSEKRAALEVVHNRLEKAGLGPFTLEAHSDKASKTQLVDQLQEPLNFQWEKSAGEWERTAASLQKQRTVLNEHAHRMHEPGPWGESLFQALSRLIGLADVPLIELPFETFPDRDQVAVLRNAVAQLARQTALIGAPAAHSWRQVNETRWTPEWQRKVVTQLGATSPAARRLAAAVQAAAVELLGDVEVVSAEHTKLMQDLGALLRKSPSPTEALLALPLAELERTTADLRGRLGVRSEQNALVLATFNKDVYEIDVAAQHAKFQKWAGAFVLFAFFALFFVRRGLRAVANGALPGNKQIAETLASAKAVTEMDGAFAAESERLRQLFGHHWQGTQTDGAKLVDVAQWVAEFRSARVRAEETWGASTAQRLTSIAVAPDERLGPDARAGRAVTELADAQTNFDHEDAALCELFKADDLWARATASAIADRVENWSRDITTLRAWCDWQETVEVVRSLKLGKLVDALTAGSMEAGMLVPAFDRILRQSWFERRVSEDDNLRRFRGSEHNAVIEKFRNLDIAARQVARAEIQARLAARLPDPTAPGEMAVLQREFTKKIRHKALRRLYEEAPQVLMRLKPCVLMSPLSVARFLDPGLDLFDLVVFDEASQIPPWDAVGALARARQAIVVGDSRQLPPTSFFGISANDDIQDDLDQVDMDSVLEECIGAGMPQLRLNWHYRSRHESLIAFSNRQYYDNNLHVFPSPHRDIPQLGLKWVPVPDGFYDRGGSTTNRAEAEAVVAEVVRRLTDPQVCHKSIGVVTFSMSQQRCVEDLMDEARRQNPEIERFFSDVAEPVFIKNLENVQGDERDVILFSVCYAADMNGKLTMNFGPLNRVGGERRLNVAITRARELLVVFSTLRPDQIDLSRTNAVGVRDLKTFLDYANRGMQAIKEASVLEPERGFDSPFEEQVAAAFEKQGWTVHPQVGVGGYWIDLGIVHPDKPGAYVLGVECDGAAYHSAKTARDRDRIRQGVLESLGWKIHRIWSTDWWHNPAGEVEKTRLAFEAALADFGQEIDAPPPVLTSVLPERSDEIPRQVSWPDVATRWVEPELPVGVSPDDFYDPMHRASMARQAAALVQGSGPLLLHHVARCVAAAWDFKATKKARRHVIETISAAYPKHVADETLWPKPDERPTNGFRYVPDDQPSRDLTQVLDWEVDNATMWVVERAISASRDDVRREVAKVFGTGRMGSKIVAQLDASINRLLRVGRLAADGDMLSMRKETNR